MKYSHLIRLLTIALAIAMTACKAKSPGVTHGSQPSPELEIQKGKLTPVSAEQLLPAKELLKNLGHTANLESYFLGDTEPTEAKYSLLPTHLKSIAADIKNG